MLKFHNIITANIFLYTSTLITCENNRVTQTDKQGNSYNTNKRVNII